MKALGLPRSPRSTSRVLAKEVHEEAARGAVLVGQVPGLLVVELQGLLERLAGVDAVVDGQVAAGGQADESGNPEGVTGCALSIKRCGQSPVCAPLPNRALSRWRQPESDT